jgi:fermentation-respiration switch protein FrsA (DUF1100 family)
MRATPWLRWLVVGLVLYAGLTLIVRLLAAKAMFQPQLGSRIAPRGMQKIRGHGGDDVAVLYLPNDRARFTIWVFHGNAEDLGDLEPLLQRLRDAGFAVFAFDYPGYGLSGGRPSEASTYASARAARAYLRDELKVPAQQTILYGRSLGGGPALEMATEERVAGVVLQSTFTSIFRVLTQRRMFPFDFYENERKIATLRCPVLIMHGRNDEVIPFAHGEALFAAAGAQKHSLWVSGATHNDFIATAGRGYWDAWRNFSDVCAQAIAASP